MRYESSLAEIPDDELLRRLAELLAQSRRVESELVAHIGEVDERGLYARHASPSMFAYWYDQTKADVFSGKEAHRGRSQKPRSLDGSQEGNRMS